MVEKRALSIEEFCEAYGICRSIAYELIKAGKLKCRKVGRRTLIRVVDADEWLNALPVLGPKDLK